MDGMNIALLNEDLVYAALQEVIDPELGINIVDLGLIYELHIDDGHIRLVMTLTTPGCPMHASFKQDIESTLWRTFPDLQGLSIELVWSPPWTPEMISDEGRARLGLW
ncbi:MAG TPA: metal-sulfur cluster assembly factor [Candidatus Sulfomarinibacteraceae bacterium]|nr:metal-sulfur cluster assembly factor [Candidatus Sulfomarinibacteraceae bacterium]